MEMLFLLKNLYRDPLALSRFSQFRYLHIGKGEIIQNLNENHEFQVCFVLKGSLCLFRDQMESMPLIAVQNEGKEKAAKVEELKKQCSIIQAAITQLSNEKEILVHNINECKGNMPEEQDTQKIILSDPTWLSLSNEIVDLENQLKAEAKPIDTTELKEAKAILSEAIDELNKKLGKRDTIERSNKVIEDLEDRRDKNNEALAEQERLEFLVQDFQKEKDNKLMERINGMFSLVKFSFISEKLNGNEAITCFCSVDGVPFADVNNASKINAGLDIINAICRSVGITAPIFIDNRESVNDLIPTMSQVINLVVSKDKSLMIRVAGNGFLFVFFFFFFFFL